MKLSFKLWALLCVAAACSTDTGAPDDASTDGPSVDAGRDATTSDARTDGSSDSAAEASMDAPSDGAGDDGSIDAADDGASSDASDDAQADSGPDASSDGGITLDGGKKSCIGVFCILGDTCCNVLTSPNYGKCEPKSCLACCM